MQIEKISEAKERKRGVSYLCTYILYELSYCFLPFLSLLFCYFFNLKKEKKIDSLSLQRDPPISLSSHGRMRICLNLNQILKYPKIF